MRKNRGTRNPVAKLLSQGQFKQKVVPTKKQKALKRELNKKVRVTDSDLLFCQNPLSVCAS
jgi:hypothetical protein